MLFSSTNCDEIVTFKRILRCFQIVSGLKINLSKSFLVGVGCLEKNIQTLADVLHCRKGSLPFQYLGLPIGANPRSTSMWNLVVEKFENKLSTWKRLSFLWRENHSHQISSFQLTSLLHVTL
eukprot:TRINITY_DN94600_c0_g1_i1.p1 TRINITY_DN94600_c0_g1~~TRINITY_DN94600_c0_g1_i1.p1  ORF type:complete len:122 (-),score=6.04 TRINITY_DN94600_c0_g1_i1:163-528(-)